jgi:hypothetical protein
MHTHTHTHTLLRYSNCDYDSLARWEACEIAGVDCKAMCDVADMSLPPPLPDPALMSLASACLAGGSSCSCPLQGGYMAFVSGSTALEIPTNPVANVNFDASVTKGADGRCWIPRGGGLGAPLQFICFVFDGTGNGKICEGYDLVDGIPKWANLVLWCWAAATFCMAIAWSRWGCVDSTTAKQARGSMSKKSA